MNEKKVLEVRESGNSGEGNITICHKAVCCEDIFKWLSIESGYMWFYHGYESLGYIALSFSIS
jgi:hypothetical protein